MARITDLIHNTKAVKTNEGTVANEVIDTLGYYSALFVALADNETFKIEESDKAEFDDAVEVAETQIIADANRVNVVPTKRYIKATVTGEAKVACLLFGADCDGAVNVG